MRNLSSYVNTISPLTSSVNNIEAMISGIDPLTGKNRSPLITTCVRTLQMDANRNIVPLNLVAPAIASDANNISDYVRSASIEHSISADVHRKLTISFTEPLATQINTTTAMMQPFIQYRDRNIIDEETKLPKVVAEFSQGIYAFMVSDRALRATGDVYNITGFDLMMRVTALGFQSPYVIPQTTVLTDAMVAAFCADKLRPTDTQFGFVPRVPSGTYPYWNYPGTTPCGCCDNPGPNFLPSRVHITPSPITAVQTIPFYTEQNQWLLHKALAAQIGYEDPWFLDQDLSCRPLPYSTDTPVSPEFRCDTGDTSMIIDITQRETDQSTWRNEVTVLSSNNNLTTPLVATQSNFSLESHISVPNVGYVISGPVIQDDRLLTQEAVNFRAWAELNFAAVSNESVDVDMGLPVPHLTNNDAIGFNVYNKAGKLKIDSRYYPFLVTGWTLDLVTKQQKITAGRLVTI